MISPHTCESTLKLVSRFYKKRYVSIASAISTLEVKRKRSRLQKVQHMRWISFCLISNILRNHSISRLIREFMISHCVTLSWGQESMTDIHLFKECLCKHSCCKRIARCTLCSEMLRSSNRMTAIRWILQAIKGKEWLSIITLRVRNFNLKNWSIRQRSTVYCVYKSEDPKLWGNLLKRIKLYRYKFNFVIEFKI